MQRLLYREKLIPAFAYVASAAGSFTPSFAGMTLIVPGLLPLLTPPRPDACGVSRQRRHSLSNW